jgi:uncharacterized protein (TIGR03086 family)
MDQLVAHQRAQDAFAAVLANVKADQMDLPSPCTEWTVKGVVDHVIGGNQWVQQLGGKEPLTLPDDMASAHSASAQAAQAVFAAPDGLTRTFELPFGAIPGTIFVALRTGDALTHAWDLARATGQSTDLDAEVSAHILDATRALVTPAFRGPGRPFAEEQDCPPGRAVADQMAAFFGRKVD